ncbi:hypothetical protein [Leisingera methylohalidivorans]|uniref:Uncharacterized protein n=1 Tax=Leisingera methylohalidivorans DSM 14336 TaxID=999552 RepID=V9VYZ9_9RHOB|nr:hypothetical protein [Leisingera methylohalidivorans]AHD03168.1 hypothetical protein METH_15295 [Leisingera methylohalidivorans DSM 14336]
MGGEFPYRPPFVLLKWALGIAGLAMAFPLISTALFQFEMEWVRKVGAGFGLAAYFGSFLLLGLSAVLAVWAVAWLGLTFVLNRTGSQKD